MTSACAGAIMKPLPWRTIWDVGVFIALLVMTIVSEKLPCAVGANTTPIVAVLAEGSEREWKEHSPEKNRARTN